MTNNNTVVIQLPIYLQKFIIKLLCNEINLNFSLMDIRIVGSGYIENEKIYKKLTINLSLVSWNWFKTVSNNIFISLDLNFNYSSKYSIIKKENIQLLKFGFNHSKYQFYSMKNGKNIKIEPILINECIEKLSSLSTPILSNLLIRNIYTSNEDISSILNKIKSWKSCGYSKISINEITLNNDSSMESLNELYENVDSIFTIITNYCIIFDNFKNVFQKYNESIKEILLYQDNYLPNSLKNLINSLSTNCGSGFNYLQNLESIGLFDPVLTIDELLILMSSKITKSLKYLSIRLCFDNLIYFLSDDQDRIGNDIDRCPNCSSVCNLNESELQFNFKWDKLIQQLKESPSTINQLLITTHCISKEEFFGVQECKYSYKLPNSFLNQFSQFISLFPNLLLFSSSLPDLTFYKSIVQKSNSLTHIQLQYEDRPYSIDKSVFISTIENDLKINSNNDNNNNDDDLSTSSSSYNYIKDLKIISFDNHDDIFYHYVKK